MWKQNGRKKLNNKCNFILVTWRLGLLAACRPLWFVRGSFHMFLVVERLHFPLQSQLWFVPFRKRQILPLLFSCLNSKDRSWSVELVEKLRRSVSMNHLHNITSGTPETPSLQSHPLYTCFSTSFFHWLTSLHLSFGAFTIQFAGWQILRFSKLLFQSCCSISLNKTHFLQLNKVSVNGNRSRKLPSAQTVSWMISACTAQN